MTRFSLHIVQPRAWPHARMFVDLARALAYSLRALGHDVAFDPGEGAYVQNPRPQGRPIILGANFLPDVPLPENAILFNTEQVPILPGSAPMAVDGQAMDSWMQSDYLRLLRRHVVWDYSAENIRRLKRLGVERVHHCRIGYSPALERLPRPGTVEEDIDVLFYGSMSPRRLRVLEQLQGMTVREGAGERPIIVAGISCVYGADLDRVLGRAKVVVNIHMNDAGVAPRIFEMVRVSYLLANHKCVVSEDGGEDEELEAFARQAVVVAPYENLAEVCRAATGAVPSSLATMRANPTVTTAAIWETAEVGRSMLRKIDQAEEVRRALGETQ